MSSRHEKDKRPEPGVTEATGDFRPEDLTPKGPRQASEMTGEFSPQDITNRTSDNPTEIVPSVQPPVPRKATPDPSGVTGEFHTEDLQGPGTTPKGYEATGEFSPEEISGKTSDGVTHLGRRGPVTGHGDAGATHAASAGAYPPMAPKVASGRYVLKRFHARGGMGEIWLAEDCDINRPVALKKIRDGRADMKERFILEAQITGQLEHPGVVPVHELSADESGQPFYVMRFIHGRTLQDVIDEYHSPSPLPLSPVSKERGRGEGAGKVPKEVSQLRLLQVFVNMCQTVGYAHSRGVIHRDLKPDNVMVGDYGETLLLDWGLAKVMGQPEAESRSVATNELEKSLEMYSVVRLTHSTEESATVVGSVKGTPGYISPEAAEGLNEKVDQSSDIFLLGATLFHILTGRVPRKGNSLFEVINEARQKSPPPPRSLNGAIPRPLNAICLKATAFRKEDRYPTALALAEDIQRYLAGEPVLAYRETLLERAWRWARRHRQLLSWSAAVALMIAIGLFGYAKWQQAEQERERERIAAAEEIRLTTERAEEEKRKKEELEKRNEARIRVEAFRQLADEMRFYAAVPDPASEQAPAFYDQESAEGKGRQALALARDWGPSLEGLVLADERPVVKNELYDLLLLMAQTRGRRSIGAETGGQMLALLDQARSLREPTASYHRLRAQAHRMMGEKEKATDEQARANDPNTPRTALDHFLLGMSYQAAAERPADTPVERDPTRAGREERVRQAMEEYRRALQQEPNHYWAHLQLGSSYLALGQPAEAAEALNACVALRPNSPWGYSVRGLARVAQKRYAEATADLDRAIRLSPDFRLPRLNRGIALWMQKKYGPALEDFDAVLRPPESQRLIEGAYYRGQIHLERGEYREALEAFDQVVDARRGFLSLQLFRARALLSIKQNTRALDALNGFLAGPAYDPQSGEAHGRRGLLLRQVLIPRLADAVRGSALTLAKAQLEKAVALGARTAGVYDDLGAVLEHLGEAAAAIEAYSQAVKLAPKNTDVLMKRGWAYTTLDPPQYDKAGEDFVKVLRLEPGEAEAHSGLGYVQACRKAPAEARVAAGRALLHGGGRYLVVHNIACIYAKLAQTDIARATEYDDLAIDHVRRAVELWTRSGDPRDYWQTIEDEPAFHAALRARRDFPKPARPPK